MACRLVSVKSLSEPNTGILLFGSLGTNFNEILIEIQIITFKEIHLKMSGKWPPFSRPQCVKPVNPSVKAWNVYVPCTCSKWLIARRENIGVWISLKFRSSNQHKQNYITVKPSIRGPFYYYTFREIGAWISYHDHPLFYVGYTHSIMPRLQQRFN